MSVDAYQASIKALFEENLGLGTLIEWRSKMGVELYAPRVDIAIGPFAYENGIHMTSEHNNLFNRYQQLFLMLCHIHLENLDLIHNDTPDDQKRAMVMEKLNTIYHTNYNARCFLAIEVENNVSRKHLMGGVINAPVLGRIGIAVGYSEEKHRAFLKLY